MGEAREVLDRVTAAMVGQDFEAAAACYAESAVGVTPDQGELRGREAIVGYLKQQTEVFPDTGYESVQKHESGNVAIDEGYLTGTHTAPRCPCHPVKWFHRPASASESEPATSPPSRAA